jgi:hypothetical protein
VHGHVLDTEDGGVGSDRNLSVLKAGGDVHSPMATSLLAMADGSFMPSILFLSHRNIGDRRWAELPGSLPVCSGRRSAWLQCFLF